MVLFNKTMRALLVLLVFPAISHGIRVSSSPSLFRPSCVSDEFVCKNQGCISEKYVCDGTLDCTDGSDETEELCKIRKCGSNEFRCGDGVCISNSWRCDGIVDCTDGTDEATKNCCTEDEFRCKDDSKCIPREFVCDNKKVDCPDGSDEASESCSGCGRAASYDNFPGRRRKRTTECRPVSTDIVPFITEGSPTDPNEYPWAVLLGYKQGNNKIIWKCGGSLISDQHVLTAAHCYDLHSQNKTRWLARLGEHVITSYNDSEHLDLAIEEIYMHDFLFPKLYSDIAIFKLSERVQFSDYIRKVCLPDDSEVIEGDFGTVIGWGHTKQQTCLSNVLRAVNLPVVKHSVCASIYEGQSWLKDYYIPKGFTQDMFCAGAEQGKRDSCQGDSGGPFLTQDLDGTYYVSGIISAGQGCGHAAYPGIYTRVTSYLPWIHNILNS